MAGLLSFFKENLKKNDEVAQCLKKCCSNAAKCIPVDMQRLPEVVGMPIYKHRCCTHREGGRRRGVLGVERFNAFIIFSFLRNGEVFCLE
jgi:hypothetical protein